MNVSKEPNLRILFITPVGTTSLVISFPDTNIPIHYIMLPVYKINIMKNNVQCHLLFPTKDVCRFVTRIFVIFSRFDINLDII